MFPMPSKSRRSPNGTLYFLARHFSAGNILSRVGPVLSLHAASKSQKRFPLLGCFVSRFDVVRWEAEGHIAVEESAVAHPGHIGFGDPLSRQNPGEDEIGD